ncbi:hypothetical protein SO802_013809 [Lithocarpus litseifolius]|uniref:Uncharacterized protein n=1 Tax=Lithocarpus litseifolius TaxID=425828 RepID=A0AAW2D9B5_9ROSI
MYRSQPHLQWLSLIFLVVILAHLLGFTVQKSEARPLNPNMEVEGRKNPSSFSSLVKYQYVANKGENSRAPPVLYSPPSRIGNHKMSAGPRVHRGDQYVPLDKGPVPPSAPNPISHDGIGNP